MDSQNKLFPQFLILSVLSLLLIIFDLFHLLTFPKKIILNLTTPIEYGIYSLHQNASSAFSFLTFWKSGYQQISYLKQRNAELIVSADLVRKLKEENEILKSQFSNFSSQTKDLLPANIIGLNRFLFINKGAKDAVKKGQAVLFNNILVGVVKSVDENLSKVELPTDPEAKIAVRTSSNGAKGILHGAFSKELILDEVIQSDKIDLNETMETFSSDLIPAGILVAKITKIINLNSSLFQKAVCEPLLDYDKLTMVFVKVK